MVSNTRNWVRRVAGAFVLVGCAAPVPVRPKTTPVVAALTTPAPAPSAAPAAAPAEPVAFDDAAILASICGNDNVVPPPYAGCLRCPPFTTYAKLGLEGENFDQSRAHFRLRQSFRGSFTAPKVEQVALTFYQGACEPSEQGSGANVVIQRGVAGLEIAHHDRAFGPEKCVAAVSSEGRSQLLCSVSESEHGVSLVVHDWARPTNDVVLDLANSVRLACNDELKRPGYALYQLQKFAWVDANQDAHPDVSIAIEYALFSGNKATRLRASCDGPDPSPRVTLMWEQRATLFAERFLKDATLQFTWRETGWDPSPETRTLLDAFDKVR